MIHTNINIFMGFKLAIYPFAGKRVRKGGSLEHHICFKMYGHLANDLPKTPGKNSLKRMHVPWLAVEDSDTSINVQTVRSCCHSFGSNWHPFESPVEIHWSCLAVTSSDASTGHRVVERCKIQKVAKYKGISHDYFQVSNILSSRNIDMLIFRSPFAIYFLVWPDFTLLVWGRNWQQVHARHAQWSCAWRLREAF